MNEDGIIELTVDGIDYTVEEEGGNNFTIFNEGESFAEVGLSETGESYTYEYSPEFASFDECSGITACHHHDTIIDFFRWVIATNQS